jgi:hypothetical protein
MYFGIGTRGTQAMDIAMATSTSSSAFLKIREIQYGLVLDSLDRLEVILEHSTAFWTTPSGTITKIRKSAVWQWHV